MGKLYTNVRILLNCIYRQVWVWVCACGATYFTEREKSPGALSLSLMRKAPSCLCLFSISSALARGIFPKNHLEEIENRYKWALTKLTQSHHLSLLPAQTEWVIYSFLRRKNEEQKTKKWQTILCEYNEGTTLPDNAQHIRVVWLTGGSPSHLALSNWWGTPLTLSVYHRQNKTNKDIETYGFHFS